ncbi:MAG: YebC/PmpR family DNA-binding transcriptional regulator [Nitrospirota bacterium]
MSGHSKWATTKHKKAAVDAKKGKVFSKISKELTVAARIGGGDPAGNPRLRLVIENAREANMPSDNIKRAIQKGTGELPGVTYEETLYEGYGLGGVAILIEIMTDNKNRTVAELRHILNKHGGKPGESGSVSWMFHKKGYILIDKKKSDEETVMNLALEAGAEDVKSSEEEENYEIITGPSDFEKVKKYLEEKIELAHAEITMLPQSYVRLEGKDAEQMARLMEAIEDHEDVQNVYANFDVPDEALAKVDR